MIVKDIPDDVFHSAHMCAIDTETTGLDPRQGAKPTLFQYHSARYGTYTVQLPENNTIPRNVVLLLTSTYITKVAHHAPFDMMMLYYWYHVMAQNIKCTKIAAKVLDPTRKEGSQSLGPLLERKLGIRLEKNQEIRLSGFQGELSQAQIDYAEQDVQHLVQLYHVMCREMTEEQRLTFTVACDKLDDITRINSAPVDLTGLYSY